MSELLPCPMCSGRLFTKPRFGDPRYVQSAECSVCHVNFYFIPTQSIPPDEAMEEVYFRLNSRANRWLRFSDEELRNLHYYLHSSLDMYRETESELVRRKAEGSK